MKGGVVGDPGPENEAHLPQQELAASGFLSPKTFNEGCGQGLSLLIPLQRPTMSEEWPRQLRE